jgi:hypothetical protein
VGTFVEMYTEKQKSMQYSISGHTPIMNMFEPTNSCPALNKLLVKVKVRVCSEVQLEGKREPDHSTNSMTADINPTL